MNGRDPLLHMSVHDNGVNLWRGLVYPTSGRNMHFTLKSSDASEGATYLYVLWHTFEFNGLMNKCRVGTWILYISCWLLHSKMKKDERNLAGFKQTELLKIIIIFFINKTHDESFIIKSITCI